MRADVATCTAVIRIVGQVYTFAKALIRQSERAAYSIGADSLTTCSIAALLFFIAIEPALTTMCIVRKKTIDADEWRIWYREISGKVFRWTDPRRIALAWPYACLHALTHTVQILVDFNREMGNIDSSSATLIAIVSTLRLASP
jgi:hypothetical protein